MFVCGAGWACREGVGHFTPDDGVGGAFLGEAAPRSAAEPVSAPKLGRLEGAGAGADAPGLAGDCENVA